MPNQRGFAGVGVLIAIVLGLVVLGGGAYYVVQQQAPSQTASENFDTVQQLPTTNNQGQQPVNNKPAENVVPSNTASVQLKTYINTKWGYSIKYPVDWSVGKEEIILDSINKIPSAVTLSSSDKKQHITILLNQKEWGLKYEAPKTQKITVVGAQQTAYLFPGGYECHMADPVTEDCSFFVVTLYRDGMWYELRAAGKAETVTNFYQQIFSTFTFLPLDPGQLEKTLGSVLPDFVIWGARFAVAQNSNTVTLEVIVENRGPNQYKQVVPVTVKESGQSTILATGFIMSYTTGTSQWSQPWPTITFDKSKIVGANKEHPALELTVNASAGIEIAEKDKTNNTIQLPSY